MSKYAKLAGQRLAARFLPIFIRLLPKLESDQMLDRVFLSLISWAKILPHDAEHRVQLEQAAEFIRQRHPVVEVIHRMFRQIHPNFLSCLVQNLWMPLWVNGSVRQEFREREGFEPPFLAVISPLKECNLQCVGCYADASREKQPERLDFATIDRIVTELKSFGTPFIVFTGGEPTHPLIWDDIRRVCAKHHDQSFMMYTNGTLLDDEKVQDLLELGNLSPAISIEGWEAETDARRGKGVFKRVVEAMDRLREAGVMFGFSLTYTSTNVQAATDPRLIQFLADKGAFYGWYFMYVPVGKDPDTNLVVSPADRDRIRDFTWRMLREKGMLIFDFWNSGHLSQGCIAGGRYLHINNRGDVEPCVFLKFTTHNIHECNVIDALRSRLFCNLRNGQTHQRNPLVPCQFMDNPSSGKFATDDSGARPTEAGGEELFRSLYPFLEKFADDYYENYAKPAWERREDYEYFRKIYANGHWRQPRKIVC
ncbi:MAG: radical SAM protein [Armatimonadetes bacterium]|nr:radical SAM protein [Armatimonadota bacterium]